MAGSVNDIQFASLSRYIGHKWKTPLVPDTHVSHSRKKTCAPCGFFTATSLPNTHPHNRSQTLRRTPPLASASCAPEETFLFALLLVERAGLGQKGLAPRRVSATRAETPYPQSFSRFFEARSPFLHLFVLRISRCRSSARLATHDLARLVLLEVCF